MRVPARARKLDWGGRKGSAGRRAVFVCGGAMECILLCDIERGEDSTTLSLLPNPALN